MHKLSSTVRMQSSRLPAWNAKGIHLAHGDAIATTLLDECIWTECGLPACDGSGCMRSKLNRVRPSRLLSSCAMACTASPAQSQASTCCSECTLASTRLCCIKLFLTTGQASRRICPCMCSIQDQTASNCMQHMQFALTCTVRTRESARVLCRARANHRSMAFSVCAPALPRQGGCRGERPPARCPSGRLTRALWQSRCLAARGCRRDRPVDAGTVSARGRPPDPSRTPVWQHAEGCLCAVLTMTCLPCRLHAGMHDVTKTQDCEIWY